MGDMRIEMGVHRFSSLGLTDKKYIDAHSEQSGDYRNEVNVRGTRVYVTDEGLRLINEYKAQDNLPDGPDMVASKDGFLSSIRDWFWGRKEEGKGRL